MERAPFSYRDDPSVPRFPDDRALMVFDGACPMCSGSARLVLRRDRRARIRVASAQSPLGQALYRHYGLKADDPQTLILLQDGRAHLRSDAVIRIAQALGGAGRLALPARILPRALRDAAYDWVARNRLRFWPDNVCELSPGIDPDRILG